MADVQPQMEQFNKTIRLGRFDEEAILREKRDVIRTKLRNTLPGVFADHDEECPAFDFQDQGSYALGTGVKPLAGEYDIDQGLYFETSIETYPDPVVLKERVYEALEGHTKKVDIRRSCVTVFYQLDDEPLYHVDIAIYSAGSCNPDGKSRHGKGRRNSDEAHRFWEVSSPKTLCETIDARHKGNDRKQFRRIIRYLKRWKAFNYTSRDGTAPNGIGLTLMTYNTFLPHCKNTFANIYDDLSALIHVVQSNIGRFEFIHNPETQQWDERLVVTLPIEPWNDVFDRMTFKQMGLFKERLINLKDALVEAQQTNDPVEACEILRNVFGDDFPVPAKKESARIHPLPIVSSGNSA